MSRRLVELAEGLVASTDDRLAPDGLDVARHYVRVAQTMTLAEMKLAALDEPPSPFENGDPRLRVSGASYAVMDAALAFWGLAVRLRSRLTGVHARRASEQLRVGLQNLAAQAAEEEDGGPELLGAAARSLVYAASAVEAAENENVVRQHGLRFDPAIEQLVAVGVISLLRVAVAVQESSDLHG